MPIKRNWKTYYTQEEVDKMLSESIRKNAEELVLELREMRKNNKLKDNNKIYV